MQTELFHGLCLECNEYVHCTFIFTFVRVLKACVFCVFLGVFCLFVCLFVCLFACFLVGSYAIPTVVI